MIRILLITLLFLVSCQPKQIPHAPTVVRDTVILRDTVPVLVEIPVQVFDSSLKRERDSILQEYYVYKYKIERVRDYIRITEANSNNKVFFLGWVKRAVQ